MDLYPYQQRGVTFLARRQRAYLADEMGLGKTVQAARAAEEIGAEEVLVIAPASALENWRREWSQWNRYKGCRLTTSSYAGLKDGGLPQRFDLVILDEAHYAKNPKAKRTLRALTEAREADRAWCLSGTPVPNHAGELYPVVLALWPELLQKYGIRTYWQWFNRFCKWTQTRYGPKVYGLRNTATLGRILKSIMLRRTLGDIGLELPPLRVDVSLLPRDERFAAELETFGVDPDHLERRITAEEGDDGSVARLRRLLGEYKAPRIGKLIARELDDHEYEKIVVLAYHHSVLDTLQEILAPFRPVGFRGDTSQKVRQRAIDEFTEGFNTRVFLAQQSSAGVALNLQAASEIVLVEPAWSPDANAQAIKRIHRIGQDYPCRARLFGVAGSLDEAIMRTVSTKTRMQADIGLK